MTYIFFYGVLLAELASERIAAMLAGLGPGRRATTLGMLHAVPDQRGWYPVLLPGDGTVHGMVHEAGLADLAALDRFEGVDPLNPAAGEYRREPVWVVLAGGTGLTADAYLYNYAPGPDLVPLPQGDFARWLRETGNSALQG